MRDNTTRPSRGDQLSYLSWKTQCKKRGSCRAARQHLGLCARHTFGMSAHPNTASDSLPFSRIWIQGTRWWCRGDGDGRSIAPSPLFPDNEAFLGDEVIMARMQLKPSMGPTQKPETPALKPVTPNQPKSGGTPQSTGPSVLRPVQPGRPPSQTPKK